MGKRLKEKPIKFRATVVVPIMHPTFGELGKHFTSSLDEILSLRPEELQFSDYEASNLEVFLWNRPKSRKLKTVEIAGMTSSRLACTDVAFATDLILRDFKGTGLDGREVPFRFRLSAHIDIACERFAKFISRLIVASHIAKPGQIRCYEPEICVDGQFLKTTGHGVAGLLGESAHFAGTESWPNIDALPILDTWRWMNSIATDGLNTDVARALSAFTHLLATRSENGSTLEDLMWAMVGLEALYGRGTSDLTYQLVEKSAALLGQKKGADKAIKEMYRCRSLFVHGKAVFPDAFGFGEETEASERRSEQAYSASMLASAVLVASLQLLVKRKWKSLTFSHAVDDPPREE